MMVRILGSRNGHQVEIGTLTLRHGKVVGTPEVAWIAQRPVIAPVDGKPGQITPDEGAAFLRGLKYHYSSAYLRATDPE